MRSAALLMLAVLLPATSASLDASLEVSGAAVFLGKSEVLLQWGGSVQDARFGHASTIPVMEIEASGELLRYQFALQESDANNPATGYGYYRVPVGNPESSGVVALFGQVRIMEAGSHFSYRILPPAPSNVTGPQSFSLSAPIELTDHLAISEDAQPEDAARPNYPGRGAFLEDAELAVPAQRLRLIVSDALVDIGGETYDTRWSTQGPVVQGIGRVVIRETRLLVAEGSVAIEGAMPSGEWRHVIHEVAGGLDGDLTLHNAAGEGELNGTPLPPNTTLFQAHGELDVRADYRSERARWTIHGEPAFVAANGATLFGQRWSWLTVETAAAAGLIALLAGVAWKAARGLSLILVGRNLADPTANAKRLEILSIVSSDPGITLPQIAAKAGVSRGTARHHMNVLQRGRLVTRREAGNASAFTLNNATFDFAVQPGGDLLAGHALGLIAHPVRKAIVGALEDAGPSTYENMRDAWKNAGRKPWSRALVSYHCNKLAADGILVRSSPPGQPAIWMLALDRPSIRRHQQATYVRQGSFAALFEALASPGDVHQLVARLATSGKPMSFRQVGRSLRVLEVTGFVRHQGGRFSRAP